MANIGISRHNIQAAYAMSGGWRPRCDGDGGLGLPSSCTVCGGTGRLLPYRVDEGVRCATCESFRRIRPSAWPATIRWCVAHESPLWSPWIWHWCRDWRIAEEVGICDG